MGAGKKLLAGTAALALVVGAVVVGRATVESDSKSELLITPRPVERRTLRDSLRVQGEVRREESQRITSAVDGKVSQLSVDDGDTIEVGSPVFAIDGRTAVAVAGTFPFYRSLGVGSEGLDVTQLETVLADAGHFANTPDPLFTEETRAALAAWQAEWGYGGVVAEPDETITVSLAPNSAGYTVGEANTTAFTLVPSVAGGAGRAPGAAGRGTAPRQLFEPQPEEEDDEDHLPVIDVTASPRVVSEGEVVTFTFTAPNRSPETDLLVELLVGGSATGGDGPGDGDYAQIETAFVFPAGRQEVTLAVPVFVDNAIEDTEVLTVTLVDPVGSNRDYKLGDDWEARVRIRANGDELIPVLSIEADVASVDEGDAVVFTITSSVEPDDDLDIAVQVAGDVTEGGDIKEIDDEVTMLAGTDEVSITVQTRRDELAEGDETLVLRIAADPDPSIGGTYVVGPGEDAVVIASDDLPELRIVGGATVAEGASTSFTVLADFPVAEDTSINYQVGGTARPGEDYEVVTGTVMMRAGTSSVSVAIVTLDDDTVFQPSDMLVADWPARVGTVEIDDADFVARGALLLNLTEPTFTITMRVSPSDRSELAVGQKATVEIDSLDDELAGAITTLTDQATVGPNGEELYEGEISVETEFDAIDGASATIDITLDERLDVLTVPVAAVLLAAGGNEVRVVNDAGTITRVPVTIGLIEDEFVEIVDGLRGDELVVVDIDPQADPGARPSG